MKLHEYITSRIEGPVVSMTMPAGEKPEAMFAAGYAMQLLPTLSVMPAVSAMWSTMVEASPEPPTASTIGSPLDLMQRMGIDEFIARQDRYAKREQMERQ